MTNGQQMITDQISRFTRLGTTHRLLGWRRPWLGRIVDDEQGQLLNSDVGFPPPLVCSRMQSCFVVDQILDPGAKG